MRVEDMNPLPEAVMAAMLTKQFGPCPRWLPRLSN